MLIHCGKLGSALSGENKTEPGIFLLTGFGLMLQNAGFWLDDIVQVVLRAVIGTARRSLDRYRSDHCLLSRIAPSPNR